MAGSSLYGAKELVGMSEGGFERASPIRSKVNRKWALFATLAAVATVGCVALAVSVRSPARALEALSPAFGGDEAYWDGLNTARNSHADMSSLVDYYNNPEMLNSKEPATLTSAYGTLDAATDAWHAHTRSLAALDRQIQRQQVTLHRMHLSENQLESRHRAIKDEISRLAHASEIVSQQLEALKGRYSSQIEDLKDEYKETHERLRAEREAAERELAENKAEEEQVREELSEALSKEAYYQVESQHAEEDVEGMRKKAHEWEQRENDHKKDMYTSEDLSAQQIKNKADAAAGEKAARLEEGAEDEIARMKARAEATITARNAQTIKVGAMAKVEQALKAAAEAAAEAAANEKEEVEKRVEVLKEEMGEQDDKIQQAKTDASDAEVSATDYYERMRASKAAYDKIEQLLKETEAKTKSANHLVETADAKAAQIETEGKMAELVAEADAASSTKEAEKAETMKADAEDTVAANDKAIEDEKAKWEELLGEAMEDESAKLASNSEAGLNMGRAEMINEHSEETLKAAVKKREEAEHLLHSVNHLSDLAKQAAQIAAAERIRAQAANAAAPSSAAPASPQLVPVAYPSLPASEGPTPASSISNPQVSVHVVPHSADDDK
mmetsp:Transcript_56380/g.115328  ORF Transcript_56380/g.115328 Transcript_56380/m.115328 type:complete len:616 (+) Transcript_56380:3-1850(+)